MDDPPNDVRLTDTQLGILAALCRPLAAGNHFATPATNQEIAAEVFLSVDAVKGHLRTLYRKFGIEDLPHNQKRARLVELAIEGGYLLEVEPPAQPAPGSVPLSQTTRRTALPSLAEEEEGGADESTGRPVGPYVTWRS